MERADFLNAITAVAAAIPLGTNSYAGAASAIAAAGGSVAGIAVPDTALAIEATTTARKALPPEIFNHSLRTFYFAELLARRQNLAHDTEILYVASILHDTGLSPIYMSEANRFEVDGANLAKSLAQKHGLEGPRADTAWDAVALHASGFAHWKQAEVRLVSQGVNADFGAYLDKMNRTDVVAILQAAPRTNFIPTFLSAVAVIGKKKPGATGQSFVTDVAIRMDPGFHIDNFVDEVRQGPDPFESYH